MKLSLPIRVHRRPRAFLPAGLTPACSALVLTIVLALVLAAIVSPPCAAQAAASHSAPSVTAWMISDIHFDPFGDPSKAAALNEAPVEQWDSILAEPASANAGAAFATLQSGCHMRGVDTPYPLLRSALAALGRQQPQARFITLSGDLLAHGLDCRYFALFPHAGAADYQAFVLKTLAFVSAELRHNFPFVPVYTALGNNDTGCGDYKLDAEGSFLAQAGPALAADLPRPQRAQMLRSFAAGGYYSVSMAPPMRRTRLIVVNDLFFSEKYRTCAGGKDAAAAAAQLTWLRRQLEEARRLHQHVWIMGHIPPGVNAFSTVARGKSVCTGAAPILFLGSDALAGLMLHYAHEIRLGIFAHTHMDELRLLRREADGPPNNPAARNANSPAAGTRSAPAMAIKLVPSISPVDGNDPSFTVAQIDPASATLVDYAVFAASNKTGIDTAWTREYTYSGSYGQPDFSAASVASLVTTLAGDRAGERPQSRAYIQHYFVGDRTPELKPFWPQYACSLENSTARLFTACVCAADR